MKISLILKLITQMNLLQIIRKHILIWSGVRILLVGLVSALSFQTTIAQELGFNDFPATYNGITITMTTNGSIYTEAYQGKCNINGGTKANSIGLSSANMYITFAFSTAVNNIIIKIGAINSGHKSVYTTNAGTVSVSKIAGDSQCGANISSNVLTYSGLDGYSDDRILVSSTSAFTSLTVTQPADNTDFAIYSLYMGEVTSPVPANPTSVSASASTICAGYRTTLTAAGAEGTVHWYSGSCGGTVVGTGNPISLSPATTTTYYAKNEVSGTYSSGCSSVSINVNQPSFVPQAFHVSDLQATGTDIKWYAASSGGSALAANTAITNGTTYYASQTVNGVESISRLAVTADVDSTPCAPTGAAGQSFAIGTTVSSLAATGSDIRWYSASSGGLALSTNTLLVTGTHYYASQTVDCTESVLRLDVVVLINE